MARRGRPSRRAGSPPSVQLAQVVGLVLLLVMIVLFRDRIAGSASLFLGAFDSPDIIVQQPDAGTNEAKTVDAPPSETP